MSNFKHGDIVVMNRDFWVGSAVIAYEGEALTFISSKLHESPTLRNVSGVLFCAPARYFDLRDPVKPVFAIDELCEVSDNGFETFIRATFLFDRAASPLYKGDHPILVWNVNGDCINWKEVRKITTVNLIINGNTLKVTQEIKDKYEAALKAAVDYGN
jgi:hypothetical protein